MNWEALCKVKHKYRPHRDPENPCRLILLCERNETHPRKEEFDHALPLTWNLTDKPCVYERHCACNDRKETKIEHRWPQHWAGTDAPCDFVKECLGGCAERPQTKTEHVWPTTWRSSEHPCLRRQYCERDGCHEANEQWDQHDWLDEWHYVRLGEAEAHLPAFLQSAAGVLHTFMEYVEKVVFVRITPPC